MSYNIRNQVQLIGHLGSDPDQKELDGGQVKTSLNLATNRSYKNAQGEKVEETDWHNVITWGKTAEIAGKYLKKGSEVAIQGRLSTRKYEKDGQTRYITEVVANELLLMGSKPS